MIKKKWKKTMTVRLDWEDEYIWEVRHPDGYSCYMAAKSGIMLPGNYAEIEAAKLAFERPTYLLRAAYNASRKPLTLKEVECIAL